MTSLRNLFELGQVISLERSHSIMLEEFKDLWPATTKSRAKQAHSALLGSFKALIVTETQRYLTVHAGRSVIFGR